MPTMAWNANRTTFTGGWPASGTMFSPLTGALGVWEGEGEQREEPRDLDPVPPGVPVVPAEQMLGRPPRGYRQPFQRGQLDRLGLGPVPVRPVAPHHLQRRGDGRRGQQDAQTGPL